MDLNEIMGQNRDWNIHPKSGIAWRRITLGVVQVLKYSKQIKDAEK